MSSLSTVDSGIVIVYLGLIFLVGIYAFIQQYRVKKKSVSSYFLAGRDITWLPIAATVFSSNIGAEHFVGLSGTAAQSGIAVATYEWTAPILIYILAYFTTFIYIPSKVVTTPEYIEKRYSKPIRIIVAIISLLLFILKTISTTIYSGAIILEQVMGWEIYVSSIALIIITGIYVTLGGLRSVVYTENVQTIILIIGGLLVCGYSLNAVNGISGLRQYYSNAENMHLIRPNSDKEWPWIGTIFTPILQSYFYWNGNHLLIQRVLSAKSVLHARYGAITCAIMKILPPFMTCLPGICARMLYPNEFTNDTSAEYDRAFPLIITRLIPNGIKGLVIAAMLSALMSSLASVYNSGSAILVNDIYEQIYPNHGRSQAGLLNIGRIGSCLFIIISMLWLPVIINSNTPIFLYVVGISATFQMPISAIFMMGHFWNRANSVGAYACLIIGLLLGFVRFISEFALTDDQCQQFALCSMNVLFFGIIAFGVSVVLIVVGSLLSKPPAAVKIDGMTYWNHWHEAKDMKKIKTGGDGKVWDMDAVSAISEIEMEHKMSDDLEVRGENKKGDEQGKKSVIAPLIEEEMESNLNNNQCKRCLSAIWTLSGDDKNDEWMIGLHLLTVFSVGLTLSVWIYFW